MKICPYGGYCIDLGNPSDCEINKPFTNCANFSSVEEKKEFDSLPNVYFFRSKEGGEIGFKNQKQLEFCRNLKKKDLVGEKFSQRSQYERH